MPALTRSQTNLEEVEIAPFAHKYLLKRPRILERSTTSSINIANLAPTPSNQTRRQSQVSLLEGPEIDNPAVEKHRYELFIDLIWVGIISNLAGNFSDNAFNTDTTSRIGIYVVGFVILFLIAWRIWNNLQEFMSKYHTTGLVERLFVVWILILAMLYGNNAPYLLSPHDPSNAAIIIFLVANASFIVVESAFSVYIPSLRRELVIRVAFAVLTLPLWIPAAIFTTIPIRASLVSAAIFAEYTMSGFMVTPPVERLLKREHLESFDADHWVERIQDFYIIILGEGVLSLIKDSPLGHGITRQAGTGVFALIAYYVLSGFYFNGDQSRRYVHAVRRTWWRKFFWLSFHVVMSGSTLMIGVSSVPLIQNPYMNAEIPLIEGRKTAPDRQLASIIYATKWVVSGSLAITMTCQTGIALLSRSLDRKGSLKVSNRYIRLLPRGLVMVIVLCLPIERSMSAGTFLGIVASLLFGCLFWEWFASLEADGAVFEP